ncbi:MAG: hypothetical protein KGJ80_05930 [Chloroflexota bacterium]|nr:hypothetical protein [Chloroflexota bacterium]
MFPQSSSARVNVFANDPNAKGLSLEQVPPPTGTSPFTIPGWTGAGGLFNPGTPQFEAGELFVVLTNTYGAWSDFFGGDFAWQPGFAQLPIFPRAGQDFNAYYDRKGLKFFSNTDKTTGQAIYTCESSDVVAHECGHAVLDAQHSEYWDSLLGETAAFHEAFGDMSAILVTLGDAAVRAAILSENGGDLAQSNAVSRLAEQLARGLFDSGLAQAVVSADALRDAVNKFRYRDPDKLPGNARASKLSSESHSFSRVFSGAFYDLLVGIYAQLRKENATLSPDAALAQARADAGHLLAQGLLLAPRGDAPFKTIASSMFTADAQGFGGRYFAALRQAFVGRRILKAAEAKQLQSLGGAGHTQTSALLGTTSAPISAPAVIDPASVRIGEGLPSGFRGAVHVPKQEFRLVGEQPRRHASRVLHYRAARTMQLKGRAFGAARGAVIDVPDYLALQVDRGGRVRSSHLHRADRAHEKRIRDHVAKLVARDRVYVAREDESVDTAQLIAQKKPYYIAYDENGDKRIRRAFIACGG